MRYTFKEREALISDPFLRETPTVDLGFDPVLYSMDLFFIDNWLMKTLYPQLDDLQNDIHWRTRMDFAVILLSKYLDSPEYSNDYETNHFDCLTRFLYERGPDCMDSEEEDSLVEILAGI